MSFYTKTPSVVTEKEIEKNIVPEILGSGHFKSGENKKFIEEKLEELLKKNAVMSRDSHSEIDNKKVEELIESLRNPTPEEKYEISRKYEIPGGKLTEKQIETIQSTLEKYLALNKR